MTDNVTVTPINIDADDDNADWAKRSWDLPHDNAAWLAGDITGPWGMTIERFMASPVYRHNVDKIPWLRELEQYR